jgi:hypothetical protein
MALSKKHDFALEDGLLPVQGDLKDPSFAAANQVFLRHSGHLVLYAKNRKYRRSASEHLGQMDESERRKVFVEKPTPSQKLEYFSEQLDSILSNPSISRDESLISFYSLTTEAVTEIYSFNPDDCQELTFSGIMLPLNLLAERDT